MKVFSRLCIDLDFEKEFIEKLVKKDQMAFNEFYLKTIDVFSRYLNTNYFLDTNEIEDILADFYVKWRDVCDKYKFEQSFSAYVWTIFKNLLKDNFKKIKDIPFTNMSSWSDDDESFEDTLQDDLDIIDFLESEYQYKQIEECMKQLEESDREIIYLKFIEWKDNNEISEILGMSVDNVRQKTFRALKKLKSLLSID